MVLIDFGDFKLRFDPKDVRISIDGEIIDVGRVFSSDEKISARREEEKESPSLGGVKGERVYTSYQI